MSLHCEPLAVDEMLARVMEMKLLQRVSAVLQVKGVACAEVKLDGVSIVDDRVRPLAPADLERRLACVDGIGDVDGRLLTACRANRICRIETAPLVGSRRSFVTPVRFRGEGVRGAQRT